MFLYINICENFIITIISYEQLTLQTQNKWNNSILILLTEVPVIEERTPFPFSWATPSKHTFQHTMIKYLILISNILSSSRIFCSLSYVHFYDDGNNFLPNLMHILCVSLLPHIKRHREYYYFNFQHIKEANKFISTIFWATTKSFSLVLCWSMRTSITKFQKKGLDVTCFNLNNSCDNYIITCYKFWNFFSYIYIKTVESV